MEIRERKVFIIKDRDTKDMHQIVELHGGKISDSEFIRRMNREGVLAKMIQKLFKHAKKKYFKSSGMPELDFSKFRRGGNLNLGF